MLEQEPPVPGNPLLTMDNVILTAHVASASARFDPARRRRVGHEIALVLNGRWPRSCVNPAALAKSGLHRWQPHSMERGPNSYARTQRAHTCGSSLPPSAAALERTASTPRGLPSGGASIDPFSTR